MENRIKIAHVGCGKHSLNNILPSYAFSPVELVALCDKNEERVRAASNTFGAPKCYTSYDEMLAREEVDAVFIVTGYSEQNRPLYPPMAIKALESGFHVWIEKPPAASVAEIEEMAAASKQAGKLVGIGFKKAFTPTATEVREVIQRDEFGEPHSVYLRYPQYLPAENDPPLGLGGSRRKWFLDHMVHPASLITSLLGPAAAVTYHRDAKGGGFAFLEFPSGALGCIHFAFGRSPTSFLERLEVIGENANIVVDNGIRLTYYRPAARQPARRGISKTFIRSDDEAPLYWEPQFSLGSLVNKQLFLVGYVPEIEYFCKCVVEGHEPEIGGLEHAVQVMKIYEASLAPLGTRHEL